jgi:hypothetical protein
LQRILDTAIPAGIAQGAGPVSPGINFNLHSISITKNRTLAKSPYTVIGLCQVYPVNQGAFPALRAGNRAIRSNLVCPGTGTQVFPLLSLARPKIASPRRTAQAKAFAPYVVPRPLPGAGCGPIPSTTPLNRALVPRPRRFLDVLDAKRNKLLFLRYVS